MPKKQPNIFIEAFKNWQTDKVPMMSAALSYYTVFSLAPLLLVIVGLIGIFIRPSVLQNDLNRQIIGMLGKNAAVLIQGLMKTANKPHQGIISVIIGTATLLLGASGIFGQLKESLNTIWHVKPKPNQGIGSFIRERLLTFSMVTVIGFILLVSLILSALLTAVSGYIGHLLPFPPFLLNILDFIVSVAAITLLFAFMFKILPDAQAPWESIWPSAFTTAVLFTIGKYAISLYIKFGNVGSAYGAAGSLIVILLWIYYATQILLFGAEMSKVLTVRRTGKIYPKKNALTEPEERDIFERVLEKKITKGLQKVISKRR